MLEGEQSWHFLFLSFLATVKEEGIHKLLLTLQAVHCPERLFSLPRNIQGRILYCG